MKKIQIGARVTEADAEFINLLEIDGATTPSDKLRAIIEEARLQREYGRDFTGSYRMIQKQLGPAVEKIKEAEFENNIHSSLLARILEWMPEFYAYCLSSLPTEKIDSTEGLKEYEVGAVDRVVRLFESLLHLELSSQASGYKTDTLQKHMDSLQELIQIINTSPKKEG